MHGGMLDMAMFRKRLEYAITLCIQLPDFKLLGVGNVVDFLIFCYLANIYFILILIKRIQYPDFQKLFFKIKLNQSVNTLHDKF